MVETESDAILANAEKEDVAFLVVGDPFGLDLSLDTQTADPTDDLTSATTHADLLLRAIDLGIPYIVIHNASIMNAVGACGLALYNFGQTVSIPFFTDSWRPSSWLGRIEENLKLGLHTLALLDIKVKEQSEENLARFVQVAFAADSKLLTVQPAAEAARSTSQLGTCHLPLLYNKRCLFWKLEKHHQLSRRKHCASPCRELAPRLRR